MSIDAMEVSYLAAHPEFIGPLASHLVEQSRVITPEQTIEHRLSKLEAHRNWTTLPVGFVAHAEGQVLGTAALRRYDLEGREDLEPWLGGVYVLPQFRRNGIGAALCSAVETLAGNLGYARLFLFTLDKEQWYHRLGWGAAESSVWRGRDGVIMQKHLHRANHNSFPTPNSSWQGTPGCP